MMSNCSIHLHFNGYVVLDLGYLLLETQPGGGETNAAFGVFYFF